MHLNGLNRNVFKAFFLIDVCSVEFLVVCLRICTGFTGVSFREKHSSMRAIGSDRQNCSHRSNSRNGTQYLIYLKNPLLGATLGATLGIGWTSKFQPEFSEPLLFLFSKLGWFQCARCTHLRFAASDRILDEGVWEYQKQHLPLKPPLLVTF